MKRSSRGYGESVIGAVSAGVFFILVGAIFVAKPNLFNALVTFFTNFGFITVPNTGIAFIAPKFQASNVVIYEAAALFSLLWGLFQVIVLVARIAARSHFGKIAETVGDITFWWGAVFLVNTYLTRATGAKEWFTFWAALIMLIGASLIVRAIILMARSLAD